MSHKLSANKSTCNAVSESSLSNSSSASRSRSHTQCSNSSLPSDSSRPVTSPITLSPDKIDTLLAEISKLRDSVCQLRLYVDAELESVHDRIDSTEKNLYSKLEQLRIQVDAEHELTHDRIDPIEKNLNSKLEQLRIDHNNLKSVVDSVSQRTFEDSKLTFQQRSDTAVQSDQVAALSQQVHLLTNQQEHFQHSCDLVIGGLSLDCFTDLSLAAHSVLSAVDHRIKSDDIVAVRPLGLSRKRTSSNTSATAAISAMDTPPPSPPTVQSSSLTTNALVDDSKEERCLKVTAAVPLLVTLSDASKARDVIATKIREKKNLHTSELKTDLILAPGKVYSSLKHPLPPSIININEYLPQHVYKLKLRVREKAKVLGFNSFIKNGNIYVRKRKDEKPTLIISDADLAAFANNLH